MFVFIDSKVYTEYGIYDANLEDFEKKKTNIRFTATKDINVFRFIHEIRGIDTLAITEFTKVSAIKDFLEKQWLDMFKNYLETLKSEKRIKNLEDTVKNLERLNKKMDLMLDTIGKKVLENEKENTYQAVLDSQKVILACERITDTIQLGTRYDGKEREKQIKVLLTIFNELEESGMKENANSYKEEEYMKFFNYCEAKGVYLSEYSLDTFSKCEEIMEVLDSGTAEKKFLSCLVSEQYYEKFFDEIV